MLIVNADDFGLTAMINQGIMEAVNMNAVNSVSLIPNGHALEQAIDFCKKNKHLKRGVHLTLIEEKPLSNPADIPSLVDSDGRFPLNYGAFMKLFFTGKINLDDVKREFTAQIELLISRGIQLDHIDSHQHLHLLGKMTNIAVDLAREFKIPRIRVVKEGFSLKSPGRILPLMVLKIFSKKIDKLTQQSFIKNADYFFGFNDSMNVNSDLIDEAVKKAKNALVELMCHPGYNQDGAYDHWNMNWNKERHTIISKLGGYFK